MADATATRDEVLVAFHQKCPRPTAADVAAWADRHPALADDIRAHAEALLAGIQDRDLRPEPSPALLERTRARALDAVAAARAGAVAAAAAPRLADMMAAAGTDVPKLALALALALGRAPLVDLVQGRVRLPAPAALLDALAGALRATAADVDGATRRAAPRMGPAKAKRAPSASRRPFADIVRDDPTMTAEQKRRWLTLFREG